MRVNSRFRSGQNHVGKSPPKLLFEKSIRFPSGCVQVFTRYLSCISSHLCMSLTASRMGEHPREPAQKNCTDM
jgi:hypothetical protein